MVWFSTTTAPRAWSTLALNRDCSPQVRGHRVVNQQESVVHRLYTVVGYQHHKHLLCCCDEEYQQYDDGGSEED